MSTEKSIVPEALEQEVKTTETDMKVGFMKRTVKVVEYPPKKIFFEYKEGIESDVLKSLKADAFTLVSSLGWGKSDVHVMFHKVTEHPALEPGYACEIQLGGDGGSYMDSLLEAVKDREVRYVWVECAKDSWAFVECKNGHLETSLSPMGPPQDDLVLSYTNKPRKMKAMFVENYIYFYVSLILFFGSIISIPAAAMFKYVWYDESKSMVDKEYYSPEKYMNIDVLRQARSTATFRLAAVRYKKSKGWYYIIEERAGGEIITYEQKVGLDGTLSDRVETKRRGENESQEEEAENVN